MLAMNVLWLDEITETVDELKAMLHGQVIPIPDRF
jgi:hypothetical protein